MPEYKVPIGDGIKEVHRPNGDKLIVGTGWATHIHIIPNHPPVIKILDTKEHIIGKENPR